ncbi:MAG: hypothetical protein Q9168_007818 [Polycauliona sp. 1 TL-2023]
MSPYLMRALGHALRRGGGGEGQEEGDGWNVAVIALKKVREMGRGDVRAVWGVKGAGRNAKKAWGEWVVHGSIPSSAILTIVPLTHLLTHMSATPSPFYIRHLTSAKNLSAARKAMEPALKKKKILTLEDGLAFGQLLHILGIPKRLADEVTSEILRDWRYEEGPRWGRQQRGLPWVERKEQGERWMRNRDFLQGREEGFCCCCGCGVGEWMELEEDEEMSGWCCIGGGAGGGTYGTAFEQSRSTTPTPQSRTERSVAVEEIPFAGFLEEVEAAAFGSSPLEGLRSCGKIEGWMDDGDTVEMKEESPDPLLLD